MTVSRGAEERCDRHGETAVDQSVGEVGDGRCDPGDFGATRTQGPVPRWYTSWVIPSALNG